MEKLDSARESKSVGPEDLDNRAVIVSRETCLLT